MVSVIGESIRVVDTGHLCLGKHFLFCESLFPGLARTIDELAGNVATKNDRISIALVKARDEKK